MIHDVSKDEWFLFSDSAQQSLYQLFDIAVKNGFMTIICNTVV